MHTIVYLIIIDLIHFEMHFYKKYPVLKNISKYHPISERIKLDNYIKPLFFIFMYNISHCTTIVKDKTMLKISCNIKIHTSYTQ